MKKKSIITLIVTVIMALLMAVQTPLTAFAAAAPKFISELLIVSAADEKQAKSKLGDDYQVLGTPLYESPKGKTYLAYKITTDPKDAIVDIKAMNMYGGYSYSEYENLLESQKAMTQQLVNGMKDAIVEFQQKYNEDKDGARYAEEMLRYFYFDDLGMTVSELFLDYDVSSGDDSALVTLFMQGNIDIIENIENLLMIACSDADNSFLEILDQKAEDAAKLDYEQPTVSEYSENIADLLNTLMYAQYPIEFYNKCTEENPFTEDIQKEFERQQEEIDAYMTENPDVDEEKVILQIRAKYSGTTAGRALMDYESYIEALSDEQFAFMNQGQLFSDVLKATRYPGGGKENSKYDTLYDLIMAHDVTDEDERAKYNVADFDELMKALTPGQRGMLKVGFAQLLSTVITSSDSYTENLSFLRGDYMTKEEYEENKEDLLPYQKEDAEDENGVWISVFEGVDRTLYDADGIAMTSEAITLQSRNENAGFQAGFLSEKAQKIMGYTAAACSGVALISTTYLVVATLSQRAAMNEFNLVQADLANRAIEGSIKTLTEIEQAYAVVSEQLTKVTTQIEVYKDMGLSVPENLLLKQQSLDTKLGEMAAQMFDSGLGSKATTVTAKATPLKAAFSQVLSRAVGMILFIIDIACLVEMVIELIIFLVDLVVKKTADAPYEPIPRVLCSAETVYNGHLNGNGERIYEDGYVFYYGVKNPEIDTTTTDPSGNLKKYAIADIYNWTLEGPDRQWIAIYTTKDSRMGNPIKADSLVISTNITENGKQAMKYFHTEQNCDTMYYYQAEKKDFLQAGDDRFVFFATMTDKEMKSVSGSVFADGKTIAFGFGGLAVGAIGGTLVTGFVKKKKETVEA